MKVKPNETIKFSQTLAEDNTIFELFLLTKWVLYHLNEKMDYNSKELTEDQVEELIYMSTELLNKVD